MKTFEISVCERLIKRIEVDANSYNEALRKALELYEDEEIELNDNDFDAVLFDDLYPDEIEKLK